MVTATVATVTGVFVSDAEPTSARVDDDALGRFAQTLVNAALRRGCTREDAALEIVARLNDALRTLDVHPQAPLSGAVVGDDGLLLLFNIGVLEYRVCAAAVTVAALHASAPEGLDVDGPSGVGHSGPWVPNDFCLFEGGDGWVAHCDQYLAECPVDELPTEDHARAAHYLVQWWSAKTTMLPTAEAVLKAVPTDPDPVQDFGWDPHVVDRVRKLVRERFPEHVP